jgi:hypothetical protein
MKNQHIEGNATAGILLYYQFESNLGTTISMPDGVYSATILPLVLVPNPSPLDPLGTKCEEAKGIDININVGVDYKGDLDIKIPNRQPPECVYRSRSDFTKFELANINGVSSSGVNQEIRNTVDKAIKDFVKEHFSENILKQLDFAIVRQVNLQLLLGGTNTEIAGNAAYRCDDWHMMP